MNRDHHGRVMQAVAGLIVTVLVTIVLAGCGGDDTFGVTDATESTTADFHYVIPVGAGAAADAGTPLDILPARLDATVGQTIEIINEDDRGHLVGPWFVGAGEVLRQTFASPGEFIGECSVHSSGQIRVVISS